MLTPNSYKDIYKIATVEIEKASLVFRKVEDFTQDYDSDGFYKLKKISDKESLRASVEDAIACLYKARGKVEVTIKEATDKKERAKGFRNNLLDELDTHIETLRHIKDEL